MEASGSIGVRGHQVRGEQTEYLAGAGASVPCKAQVDAGERAGTTSSEHAEIRRLKREVADLRRANEILKSASTFFAAELDRPATK